MKLNNKKIVYHKRYISIISLLILVTVTLGMGCQKGNADKKEIVFTTGLSNSDLFKIGNNACKISEANILLLTMQKKYQKIFGKDNWDQKFSDGTVGDYVKQQVTTQLSQIKSMNLMAEKNHVELNNDEKKKAQLAADEFNAGYTDAQRKTLGFEKEEVKTLFLQYALSKKLYNEIIKEVNTEISDDEARIIRIQQILLKTYHEDENGNKSKMSKEERATVNDKASQLLKRANAGEDFENLAAECTEDSTIQYTIGRGEMPENFEEEVFNMKNNDISQVIETEYGLHIIKCISNYEQSETEANKKVIYEKRCAELFNKKYDAFMQNIAVQFNDKAWDKVKLINCDEFAEKDFFELYNKYFV